MKGYLVADSHYILNGSENYFSRLLNVRRVNDARRVEIYTAEPLIPEPRLAEIEIATAKLKRFHRQLHKI
jgi:hypothetical protein